MNIKNKSIMILIIFILLICMIPTVSNADTYTPIPDPTTNYDNYAPGEVTDATKLQKLGNAIVGIIQVIGSGVSVVVLVIIGIKYMIGTVEEKAQYKQTLVPYLVGAVLLFATSNVVSMIYDFAIGI